MRKQLRRQLNVWRRPPRGVDAELAEILADPVITLTEEVIVGGVDQSPEI